MNGQEVTWFPVESFLTWSWCLREQFAGWLLLSGFREPVGGILTLPIPQIHTTAATAGSHSRRAFTQH